MHIAVIGAGRIGGNIARQLVRAGHALTLSFARDTAALQARAEELDALTAAFQAQVADRPREQRVVQWLCGDDAEAKELAAGLIEDAGYAPVDLGGIATCHVMEAPRRPGAVYGEEWRLPEALGVVEALREGRPISPTPHYAKPGG